VVNLFFFFLSGRGGERRSVALVREVCPRCGRYSLIRKGKGGDCGANLLFMARGIKGGS